MRLTRVAFVLDPNLPNVQVTKMTLMCDTAPSALVLDLTGESPPLSSSITSACLTGLWACKWAMTWLQWANDLLPGGAMFGRLTEPEQEWLTQGQAPPSERGVFTAGWLAWLSVAHIISFEYKVKGLLDFLFLPGYILSKPSFSESDLCDGVYSPTSYMSFVPLPCVSASTFQTKYFLGGETCLGLAAVYS